MKMKRFIESLFGKMVLTVAVFIVIWPLLDLAWAKLITRSVFEYRVVSHLVIPAGIAVVWVLLEHFVFRKKDK